MRRSVDRPGLAGRSILVPATVVAEVANLISRFGDCRIDADFVVSMADGTFEPVDLTAADYRRTSEFVERLGIHDIATLDRRHFTVVRPRHTQALKLLP